MRSDLAGDGRPGQGPTEPRSGGGCHPPARLDVRAGDQLISRAQSPQTFALNLLAFEVAVGCDEQSACPGAGHRNRDFVGAVLALEETSERGGLDRLLTPAVAAIRRIQVFSRGLILALIVVDIKPQS